MKKVTFAIIISFLLSACGAMRVADVTGLSGGMTKAQVDNIMGLPVRLLSNNYTQEGVYESFEYITYRDESYAIEFLNGRLTRYDFMYENATPIPPGQVRPPVNPPTYYPNRPGNIEHERPGSGSGNGRPGNSGSSSGRPGSSSGNGRPENGSGSNTGRPGSSGGTSERPGSGSGSNTGRPSGNSGTGGTNTRPSTRPAPASTTPQTRPSTRESSSSTRTEGTTSNGKSSSGSTTNNPNNDSEKK